MQNRQKAVGVSHLGSFDINCKQKVFFLSFTAVSSAILKRIFYTQGVLFSLGATQQFFL